MGRQWAVVWHGKNGCPNVQPYKFGGQFRKQIPLPDGNFGQCRAIGPMELLRVSYWMVVDYRMPSLETKCFLGVEVYGENLLSSLSSAWEIPEKELLLIGISPFYVHWRNHLLRWQWLIRNSWESVDKTQPIILEVLMSCDYIWMHQFCNIHPIPLHIKSYFICSFWRMNVLSLERRGSNITM